MVTGVEGRKHKYLGEYVWEKCRETRKDPLYGISQSCKVSSTNRGEGKKKTTSDTAELKNPVIYLACYIYAQYSQSYFGKSSYSSKMGFKKKLKKIHVHVP